MAWRKITVDNIDYEFMLGKKNAVIKHGDKKTIVTYTELTGRSEDSIAFGKFWGIKEGMVTPAHIIFYIKNKL
jgi:hypothetical protein